MSVRQQVMMGVLAITLVAMLGATAPQDAAPRRAGPGVWLDPSASDELLAARLNLTNVPKSPRSR
jgi:hypothetical protein